MVHVSEASSILSSCMFDVFVAGEMSTGWFSKGLDG